MVYSGQWSHWQALMARESRKYLKNEMKRALHKYILNSIINIIKKKNIYLFHKYILKSKKVNFSLIWKIITHWLTKIKSESVYFN